MRMKKILSLTLAILLILSLGIQSFSADELDGFDFGDEPSNSSGDGFDFGDEPAATPQPSQTPQPTPVVETPDNEDSGTQVPSNENYVIEDEYTEAYKLLKAISLVSDDDGLNTKALYSKKQLAKLGVDLLRIPTSATDTVPFSDVDKSDKYYPYIAAAYNAKLIDEATETTFKPDAPVSAAQLYKVLLKATGYDAIADEKGGYPTGYLILANEKKIARGINIGADSQVTLGIILKTVFNAINIPINKMVGVTSDNSIYEQSGQTLLQKNYDIYRAEGIFNEFYGSNLYGNSYCNQDEILVDRIVFKDVNKVVAKDMFAKRVIVYAVIAEKSNSKDIVFMMEDPEYKDNYLYLKDRDIQQFSNGNELFYEKDSNEDSVYISENAYIMYNGAYLGQKKDLNLSTVLPKSGEVIVGNFDDDTYYDSIQIWDFRYAAVDSVNVNLKRIYFDNDVTYNGQTFIDIDSGNKDIICNVYMNNESIDASKIMEGDILSIARSSNITGKKVVKIFISRENVTGTVKEIDIEGKVAVIDETKYNLAFGYDQANIVDMNEAGVSAKFSLTHRGEIFGIDSTGGASEIGYLVGYKTMQKMDKVFMIKVFTPKGKWESYECQEKVTVFKSVATVNGNKTTINAEEIIYTPETYSTLEVVLHSAMTFENKLSGGLIGYTLKDNKVKEIYVSDDLSNVNNYPGLDKKNFSLDSTVTGTVDTMRIYEDTIGAKMFVGAQTKVFLVPDDISNGYNEKSFKVGSVQILDKPRDYYLKNSRIYEVGADRSAGYIIQTSSSVGADQVSLEADSFIVSKVTKTLNDEKEPVYKISGMRKGKDYSVFTSISDVDPVSSGSADKWYRGEIHVSALKPGDVLQIITDATDCIVNFRILFRLTDPMGENWEKPEAVPANSKMSNLHTVYGVVQEKDKNMIIVNSTLDGNAQFDKAYRTINTSIHLLKKNQDSYTVQKASFDEISPYDKVVIRSWWNIAKEIYIIRDEN